MARILYITMISVCFVTLSVFAAGCNEDGDSGDGDADADSDSDSDADGDADTDTEASALQVCADFGDYMQSECNLSDAELLEMSGTCLVISQMFSASIMPGMLECVQSIPCEDLLDTDTAASDSVMEGCMTEVITEVPVTAEAQMLVDEMCAYEAICGGLTANACQIQMDETGMAGFLSILPATQIDVTADCIPAEPDCSPEESDAMNLCVEENMALF